MLLPVKLLYALREQSAAGLVAAAAAVAVMFGATPFLIPELSTHFEVSEGIAGTITVAQVGAFAAVSVVLPRYLNPTSGLLGRAAWALLIANALSVVAPNFATLLAIRAVAGAAAGTMTWIAWADAMQQPRSMARLAATGPVTALVSAPLLSLIAELGHEAVYVALGLAGMPILALDTTVAAGMRRRAGVSRSRSNRVLLGALFLQVFAGSALFIYAAVAAREQLDMSPIAASFGFSLNALGGLIGARLSTTHRRPGIWLASSGVAAFLTVAGGHEIWFFAGLFWWGLAFWMGIPGVMTMLAERSIEPSERAGDAQGVMAFGRSVGPVLGGAFVDADAFRNLAIVVGIGMTTSGLTVAAVQEGREHLPPRAPIPEAGL